MLGHTQEQALLLLNTTSTHVCSKPCFCSCDVHFMAAAWRRAQPPQTHLRAAPNCRHWSMTAFLALRTRCCRLSPRFGVKEAATCREPLLRCRTAVRSAQQEGTCTARLEQGALHTKRCLVRSTPSPSCMPHLCSCAACGCRTDGKTGRASAAAESEWVRPAVPMTRRTCHWC